MRSRISTTYLTAEENEGSDNSIVGWGWVCPKGLASSGFIIELHVNFVSHSETSILGLVFNSRVKSNLY